MAYLLSFRLRKTFVDLCVELASCNPHRVVVTLVETADKVDILAVNCILIEHGSCLLQRRDCLALDYRVV